ncbi:hypothetical protein [Shinella sp.]|uniref:hypothetical protein n=1 Tax=Shinella sp. TaxID=1870904 RepID=UPI0040371D72
MKSILLPLAALLVGITAVIWLGGVRIIVIQPIGALPNGVTAIVAGLSNVNLLDSPDAICNRHEGGVSLLCRGREAAAIAEKGNILLRLPYSETLYRMTGAPELGR